MLLVNDAICYSPYAPFRDWPAFRAAKGIPPIALWNLAWLSCPQLDACSNAALTAPKNLNVVVATLLSAQANLVPEWPYLLTLEPQEFFEGFVESKWWQTMVGVALGHAWFATVEQRARQAQAAPLPLRDTVVLRGRDYVLRLPLPLYEGVMP